MAERPIFIPRGDKVGVIEKSLAFTWFAGFAAVQKQKSIQALHEAAKREDCESVLEISSKGEELGQKFSAFALTYATEEGKGYCIENLFQGSKVFESGGPYYDLYDKKPREAKRDDRLRNSGQLTGFAFFAEKFPLQPVTYFYDYLYINALLQDRDHSEKLLDYDGFTDIEFNPRKSLNCQAYSAALYVSLEKNGQLDKIRNDKEAFLETVKNEYAQRKLQVAKVTKKYLSKGKKTDNQKHSKTGRGLFGR